MTVEEQQLLARSATIMLSIEKETPMSMENGTTENSQQREREQPELTPGSKPSVPYSQDSAKDQSECTECVQLSTTQDVNSWQQTGNDFVFDANGSLGLKNNQSYPSSIDSEALVQASHSHTDIVEDSDTVQISRTDLLQMIEQILAAQNMHAVIQSLHQQNVVLKETVQQSGMWAGIKEKLGKFQSLPNSGGQIFSFDGFTPGPHTMAAPRDRQSVSSSGYSSSHTLRSDSQTAHQASMVTLPSQDGESDSAGGSLELSSNLSFDGDGPHQKMDGTEASGMTTDPLPLTTHYFPSSDTQNIPQLSILEPSGEYSMAQHQSMESLVGTAGLVVQPEQYQLLKDELHSTKEFIRKVTKEGGLSPNNINVRIVGFIWQQAVLIVFC